MGFGGYIGTPTPPTGDHPLGAHCGDVPCTSYKDHQDRVSWVIQRFDVDELALLYKELYLLGQRYDQCDARIKKLKERYAAKPGKTWP